LGRGVPLAEICLLAAAVNWGVDGKRDKATPAAIGGYPV
jgi:hypothetical protein